MRSWRRVDSGGGDALRGDRWATHRHEERWWKSRACAQRGVRLVAAALLGLAWIGAAPPAAAQPLDVPATYGGDLWTRPRLTGDWLGYRDELAKKGVALNVDVLLTPQGVASGGRDTGVGFWGDAEYNLGVDTGKLGLWPGGFLNVLGISTYGNSIQNDSGAILPVKTVLVLTDELGEAGSALMNLTFMQFLSPKFGLFAGKVYTLADGDTNEFAQDYHTTFVNPASTST